MLFRQDKVGDHACLIIHACCTPVLTAYLAASGWVLCSSLNRAERATLLLSQLGPNRCIDLGTPATRNAAVPCASQQGLEARARALSAALCDLKAYLDGDEGQVRTHTSLPCLQPVTRCSTICCQQFSSFSSCSSNEHVHGCAPGDTGSPSHTEI
jgi:hypothetical protein